MLSRRQFVSALSAGTAAITVGRPAAGVPLSGSSDRLGQLLPMRQLGSTGERLTVLGLGGYHTGNKSPEQAQAGIETALEGGIRLFDNAEDYQNGGSEELFGRFLTPKYRDVVFILTKTTAKDAATARKHLEGSLRRLKTDYIDLYKIHAVTSPEDVDTRLDNGVLDVLLEAREQGKVRHIGFTGHSTPDAHRRMLERTEVLETCLMPINVVDPHYKSFIRNVLPTLVERKMGVLAMKTGAFGNLFRQGAVPDRISFEQIHHFVLSLPVCSLLVGYDNPGQIKEKIAAVQSFEQLDEAQREAIVEKVADLAGPKMEGYKSRA